VEDAAVQHALGDYSEPFEHGYDSEYQHEFKPKLDRQSDRAPERDQSAAQFSSGEPKYDELYRTDQFRHNRELLVVASNFGIAHYPFNTGQDTIDFGFRFHNDQIER
jgi:hypothetical protein